ncbi:hypothetical protein [Aquamicrobium sp.]|uniref:hypothetical protein n=1 Tax=Aquamicrobium sp. TaxID=1872579 RepID=UPI00258CED83|nr:hypothetical protein [Aquamicrobium sp.]MCK9550938.1 hypothetical protein [Aquamicrobium sp.]
MIFIGIIAAILLLILWLLNNGFFFNRRKEPKEKAILKHEDEIERFEKWKQEYLYQNFKTLHIDDIIDINLNDSSNKNDFNTIKGKSILEQLNYFLEDKNLSDDKKNALMTSKKLVNNLMDIHLTKDEFYNFFNVLRLKLNFKKELVADKKEFDSQLSNKTFFDFIDRIQALREEFNIHKEVRFTYLEFWVFIQTYVDAKEILKGDNGKWYVNKKKLKKYRNLKPREILEAVNTFINNDKIKNNKVSLQYALHHARNYNPIKIENLSITQVFFEKSYIVNCQSDKEQINNAYSFSFKESSNSNVNITEALRLTMLKNKKKFGIPDIVECVFLNSDGNKEYYKIKLLSGITYEQHAVDIKNVTTQKQQKHKVEKNNIKSNNRQSNESIENKTSLENIEIHDMLNSDFSNIDSLVEYFLENPDTFLLFLGDLSVYVQKNQNNNLYYLSILEIVSYIKKNYNIAYLEQLLVSDGDSLYTNNGNINDFLLKINLIIESLGLQENFVFKTHNIDELKEDFLYLYEFKLANNNYAVDLRKRDKRIYHTFEPQEQALWVGGDFCAILINHLDIEDINSYFKCKINYGQVKKLKRPYKSTSFEVDLGLAINEVLGKEYDEVWENKDVQP